MYLRLYRPEDLESLTRLFFETIHTVNAGDYTPEQLWAWAPGAVDAARWDHTLREHHSLVALDGDLIIGFGDMDIWIGFLSTGISSPAGPPPRSATHWNAMPRPPASLILPPTPPSPPGPSSLTGAIGPSGNSRWYGVLSCSPILSWKSRSPDRQCGTTGA